MMVKSIIIQFKPDFFHISNKTYFLKINMASRKKISKKLKLYRK